MARDINQIQSIVSYIIRMQRGAFQTFAQVDTMLHESQMDLYESFWKQYEITGVLPEALEPFKSRFSFSYATSVNGLVSKPDDYGRFLNGYSITLDNARAIPRRNKLTPVNEDEIVDALNNQVRPVSVTYPLIVKGATKFVIYPQQPQAGEINYLITPAPPVFAYSQVGRVITYLPNSSTQLLWDDTRINDVILGALSYIGINLNESAITAYAESKQAEVK